MSTIQLNGKSQEIAAPISLLDLLKNNNVEQPDMVSIQVNGEFVSRENFETTLIQPNDEIDFLFFMGGGSSC
jgi:sulfur carrier protein